jgi:hypothetical protein
MKNLEHIAVLIFSLSFFYLLSSGLCEFFPQRIVETKIELIPGDTVVTTRFVTVHDTVFSYRFKTEYDTVFLHDTTYVLFSSRFFLGDSTLGTSGRVSFQPNFFTFDSIEYRYPEKTKTIIDTLKLFADEVNHFHFGIVSGYGIGIRTFTPDIFIGVGFSIKVF